MKIILKDLKGCVGECNGDVVRVDLTKDTHSPGSTLVHEVIHHLYPEMLEKNVRKWEKRIWRRLPYKTKIDVYKQLLDKRANLIIRIVKEKIG